MKFIKLFSIALVLSLILNETASAEDNVNLNQIVSVNRLNQEIHEETAAIINKDNLRRLYGAGSTNLAESFNNLLDEYMPMALSICETGCWIDTRYTWSSAVYSSVLVNSGVNMNNIVIAYVNSDTYIATGNEQYLGCGSNCTASKDTHYHFQGLNDNDSLGPLQILRHYVEDNGYLKFNSEYAVTDLMSWRDNVIYFSNKQCSAFNNSNHWNKDYELSNQYELMMLIGVSHNTGQAFQTTSSGSEEAGSLWLDAKSIYNFCKDMSSSLALSVLNNYVDDWFDNALIDISNNVDFNMAGQCSQSDLDKLILDIGLNKNSYAKSFGHKQYYPIRAVLNYMSLLRLYGVGVEGSDYEKE